MGGKKKNVNSSKSKSNAKNTEKQHVYDEQLLEDTKQKSKTNIEKSPKKEQKNSKYETAKKEEEKSNSKVFGTVLVVLIMIVAVILLLLKCNKETKEYTIRFNTSGGNAIAEQKVNENGTISKPADPTRDGYVFVGWFLEGEDEPFDFSQKVTANMVIEARWKLVEENDDNDNNENNNESSDENNEEKQELEGISLDGEVTLKVGSTSKLVVQLKPNTIDDVELSWSSSDTSIVKVDNNGQITALKKGKATVTVTTKDGKFKANCTVTVGDSNVSVSKIVLDKHDISLSINQSTKVGYKITPSNASNKQVKWKSENSSIASVDSNGKITAHKSGTTKIIVTTNDGSKTDSVIVRVRQESKKEPETVVETGVTISGSKEGKVGSTINLTATVRPNNATNKSVTWSSSNTDVATVDKNGRVTLKKAGTTVITVKTANGKTDKCTITVTDDYHLTLTALITKSGIHDYRVKVTKNGGPFSEYKGISYSSEKWINYGNPNTDADGIDTSITKATIVLKDGTKASISIDYKSETLE